MIRRLRLENLVLIREAELELGTGLAVVTGETGAGKTIFAQALGLLLGMSGERGLIGASASEAYVEAELDLPEGILESDDLEALREIRPQGEEGVVLARRLF
ncbi:MAG: AAA family ATPase, partial [Gaiellales bacterium]